MKFRPYQSKAYDICLEYFKSNKPVPSIAVLPTAWGKSFLIAQLAKTLQKGVLILQPSIELLDQNYNKFISTGEQASVYSASKKTKEIGNVTYATLGSIISAENIADKFSYIIIDECHLYSRELDGQLRKFLNNFPKNIHILGVTATPIKLTTITSLERYEKHSELRFLTSRGKEGAFFKKILYVSQIKEIVEMGYWSKLIYDVRNIKSNSLKFNSTRADYTGISMKDFYEAENIEEKVIEAIKSIPERKSILVSTISVDHAISLAKKLENAKAVWGNMDKKERQQIVDDFKELKVRIVVQVNVLSTGFDHPELDTIICARPTASLSYYYQLLGRGTRIHPNKENCLIIDLVGNVSKFGKIEHLWYEDYYGWKIFNLENSYLLTDVPLDKIGKYTKESLKESYEKLTFGQYKGKYIHEVPISYLTWLLPKIKQPVLKFLKKGITEYLKKHNGEKKKKK